MVFIAAFFGLLALSAFSAVWKGYVLTVLWGWFVVPIFHLPALSLAPAIGLSLVVGYLTQQVAARSSSKGTDAVAEAIAHAALLPLFALGVGWVVAQFM